ncbi:MAG: YwiC-like family protein [Thermodesulfovibrionales bacterium]
MKNYILSEYGSWSVLLFSFLSGIILAQRIELSLFLTFSGLCLFINSKQAYVIWQRLGQKEAFIVFIAQILTGLIMFIFSMGAAVFRLYPLASIPLIYLLFLRYSGEHSIFTEIAGFLTLCLASPVTYFSLTEEINLMLYIIISLFFIAGVFKVRVQLKRGIRERILMILYLIFLLILSLTFHIRPWIFTPLIDNLIFSLTLYRVRLKVTGWIEVAKGILFLLLLYSETCR